MSSIRSQLPTRNGNILSLAPTVNFIISPTAIRIILIFAIGYIVVSKAGYQLLQILRETRRKRNSLHCDILLNQIFADAGVRSVTSEKLIDGNAERVIVRLFQEKIPEGFWCRILRCHTGFGNNDCIAAFPN